MQHLHHYIDQVCAGPGAKPAPCGERQTYRPPVGQRTEYADVLVSKDDLRELILRYSKTADLQELSDGLVSRLVALLD